MIGNGSTQGFAFTAKSVKMCRLSQEKIWSTLLSGRCQASATGTCLATLATGGLEWADSAMGSRRLNCYYRRFCTNFAMYITGSSVLW